MGAYISHKKDDIKVSNKFAGNIGKINLYESEFDKSKIKDLFLSPFNVQKSSETIDIIENKEVEKHSEEKEHEEGTGGGSSQAERNQDMEDSNAKA